MKTNAGQFKKGHIPADPIKKGEHRGLQTEFKKGQLGWNKGLTAKEDSRIVSGSRSGSWKGGKIEIVCQICGKIDYDHPSNNRKYCSLECYRLSKRNSIPWNKGKKDVMPKGKDSKTWKGGPQEITCEICGTKKLVRYNVRNTARFCSNGCRGVWVGNQYRGRKLTPEQIKTALRRRTPTSLEEQFSAIIKKYNLPYKYVGNGAFIIENCNPDFINTNHEKIAIEVYAKFYKELDGRTVKGWKSKRTRIFKKYGWKVIYFEASEVKEKKVLEVLKSL